MATKFVTNIDLNQNQILNGRLEALASDPGSGNFEGRLIYNTTEDLIKFHTGSAWRKTIHTLASNTNALTVSESNGTATYSIATAIASGNAGLLSGADKQILDDATSTSTASTLAIRDGSGRLQVASPSADLDAANKAYVDAARTGLDVKASVRAATTAAITIANQLENGDTLDGVTLATGDRVLVKDQSTGSENGIYIVAASGAPSRATDADSNSEVTPGMFTFVEEGTTNADSGWVCTNDGAITVGTTALTFSLFSVAGTIFAGDGLSKSGDTLNVNVANTGGIEIASDNLQIEIDSSVSGLDTSANGLALQAAISGAGLTFTTGVVAVGAGDGITVNANDVALASTTGGAGLTFTSGVLAVGAGDGITVNADDVALASSTAGHGLTFTSGVLSITGLAVSASGLTTSTPTTARIASDTIGDGSNTSFVITHNMGTRDVIIQVYDAASYDTVIADVVRSTTDTATITFSSAPSSNAYVAVITG